MYYHINIFNELIVIPKSNVDFFLIILLLKPGNMIHIILLLSHQKELKYSSGKDYQNLEYLKKRNLLCLSSSQMKYLLMKKNSMYLYIHMNINTKSKIIH